MSILIGIPSSIQVSKLDNFAVRYFDSFFTKLELENWLVFEVRLIQTIGKGTRIIEHLSSKVELTDAETIDIDLSTDVNLLRIISRIQKRKGSGEVRIEIYKKGKVVIS